MAKFRIPHPVRIGSIKVRVNTGSRHLREPVFGSDMSAAQRKGGGVGAMQRGSFPG